MDSPFRSYFQVSNEQKETPMDTVQIIVLVFQVLIMLAIIWIPYLIISKIVRSIIRSMKKVYHEIFD